VNRSPRAKRGKDHTGGKVGRKERRRKTAPSIAAILLDGGRPRQAQRTPEGQRKASPRQGPRGEAEGGACCKEVGGAPQILATLPLSYRNTDGGGAFVHAAPPKERSGKRRAAGGSSGGREYSRLAEILRKLERHNLYPLATIPRYEYYQHGLDMQTKPRIAPPRCPKPCPRVGLCYRELRRIRILGRWVNSPS
jgi:hypothetical protein